MSSSVRAVAFAVHGSTTGLGGLTSTTVTVGSATSPGPRTGGGATASNRTGRTDITQTGGWFGGKSPAIGSATGADYTRIRIAIRRWFSTCVAVGTGCHAGGFVVVARDGLGTPAARDRTSPRLPRIYWEAKSSINVITVRTLCLAFWFDSRFRRTNITGVYTPACIPHASGTTILPVAAATRTSITTTSPHVAIMPSRTIAVVNANFCVSGAGVRTTAPSPGMRTLVKHRGAASNRTRT